LHTVYVWKIILIVFKIHYGIANVIKKTLAKGARDLIERKVQSNKNNGCNRICTGL
jgi:hypothetical protein